MPVKDAMKKHQMAPLNPGNAGENRTMRKYVHGHVKSEIKAGILMGHDRAKAESIGSGKRKAKKTDWSKARA